MIKFLKSLTFLLLKGYNLNYLMPKMDKEEFRKRIQERDRIDRIRSAIHARKFSSLETFEQGLALTDFALRFKEDAKRCER